MAQRGITAEARSEIRRKLNVLRALEDTSPPAQGDAQEREQGVYELHAMLTEWSSIAKTVIRDRRMLLRLGIDKRRPRTRNDAPSPNPMPVRIPTTPVQ